MFDFSGESRNEKLGFVLPTRKKTPNQRTIYQCDKCQKQFGLKRNFMHHINSHLGIKPYACSICDKRFVQTSHLNTHMKILHTGLKPYICHKCGKSFAVSSNLKKHAAIHGREEVTQIMTKKNRFIYHYLHIHICMEYWNMKIRSIIS